MGIKFLNKDSLYLSNRLLLLLLIAFVFSCKTTKEVTYTNLASNYKSGDILRLEGCRVFNETDSISRVFIQYHSSGLKYQIPPGELYFRADYSVSFKLFSSGHSNKILSQQTFFLSDSLHHKNPQSLRFDFPVAAKFPGDYYLEVKLYDINADQEVMYPINVEKSTKSSAQYFLPIDENDEIILEDWLSWKTKFRLQCSDLSIRKLFVYYYNRDFPVAAPPFSQARPQVYSDDPDEEFTVEIKNGLSENMQFAKEGFYFFTTGHNEKSGFTIFRFQDYFPKVKRPEQLVEPLRYLCSNKEFEQLKNAQDEKLAVDNFWLENAGNEERATALIQRYYGRVEQANLLFSSHKEGWKTDRGMIYIIFGEPKTVYFGTDVETWIYGEQGNRVYLTFDFIRVINRFSANDFELQRLPEFKEQWYNAVLFWRQ
ncbi:MAG: GWxTD domain-containing protein [Bacteroidales bacterium]|nr:GWxTD domain-containing protein [Bacteroidales bacterium]